MSAILEYKVTKADHRKTVEYILRKKLDISSTLLTRLKQNSKLFLNSHPCRTVDICECGDKVTADVSENLDSIGGILPQKMDLNILFEDDFVLVVNKPGDVASHPCPGNYENSLANGIMYYWSEKGEYHNYHIVNRLDKGTSGICIIAKNKFAHGVISSQLKNLSFERGYFAVVHGEPMPNEGIIEKPIRRDTNSIIKREVAVDGKYAKTLYKTIKKTKRFSLLDIRLETGRTHQIRVHFSHMGHPLVGDWLYGNGDEEKHLISRPALHAGYVRFLHPASKNEMVFRCEPPVDINNLLLHL